jgi:hypothetical protein
MATRGFTYGRNRTGVSGGDDRAAPTRTVTPPAPPAPPAPKHRQVTPPPPVPAREPSRIAAVRTRRPAPPPTPNAGFVRANLTRKPTPYPASAATFTAIDLETAGLDAVTDRIVEIGLVKFTADGTIIDEFATLHRVSLQNAVHLIGGEQDTVDRLSGENRLLRWRRWTCRGSIRRRNRSGWRCGSLGRGSIHPGMPRILGAS